MDFDWWLKDDPEKNDRTLDILHKKNITLAMIQEWHAKNRLEKYLKKNGFKPLEASTFRVLFEQQLRQQEILENASILEMNDTQLALEIMKQDANGVVDILAALRRHAYAQGFAAGASTK